MTAAELSRGEALSAIERSGARCLDGTLRTALRKGAHARSRAQSRAVPEYAYEQRCLPGAPPVAPSRNGNKAPGTIRSEDAAARAVVEAASPGLSHRPPPRRGGRCAECC